MEAQGRLELEAFCGRERGIADAAEILSEAKDLNERMNGGPGQIRTADLRFRKPSLYPSELQGLN